jgi:hypothetical protein
MTLSTIFGKLTGRTQSSPDPEVKSYKNGRILSMNRPNQSQSVIMMADLVNHLGGAEQAFRRYHTLRNFLHKPLVSNEAMTMQHLRFAEANERLGSRHYTHESVYVRRNETNYDLIWGTGYWLPNGSRVLVNDNLQPIKTILASHIK